MRPRLRVWFPLIVAMCVPAGLWAQNPDNTVGAMQGKSTSVVQKPVRKPDQVITNDTIGLLAVRRAPRILPAEVAAAPAAVPEEGAAADAATKRAVEMSSLEKEVKDRQKRVALLMKLFVNDEKEFLKCGGAAEADPAVQERRKYEQDELRWETAELAKVTARLEELKVENRK